MSEAAVAVLRDAATESRLSRLERTGLLTGDFPCFSDQALWQQSGIPLLLSCCGGKLQLQSRNRKLQPLAVDFSEGTMAHRSQQNVRAELVVKAVLGRNKQRLPSVIDATAGLGRDSFLLAVLGCEVLMVERHPVVGALLEDGLMRYQQEGDQAIASRLAFCSQDFLLAALPPADVVYLDPMFPKRDKSALVKKEMQLFKTMVGADTDSDSLLGAATALARERVVVKRPDKAPFLADVKPTYSLSGRSSRFDIYQVGSKAGP
ncbi:MAG: class I SAM-dependent methyltransferase [Ketobacteraceae bacterium]|nr:class I SAM-dependent methyltransferase [Ketobacteraceae bacterium]